MADVGNRFLLRVPPVRAFEIAADPSRFPEFNPVVRVPESGGRVEEIGNVLPDGLIGHVLDLVLMRPLLAVGFGLLGRRMRRWIEAAGD